MVDNDDIVREIYAQATQPQPWRGVLATTAQRFRASSAFAFTAFVPPDDGGVSVVLDLDESRLRRYLAEVATVDIWYHALVRREGGRLSAGVTYVGETLVPERELRRSRFHADYLNPSGIGHTLGTVVGDGSSPVLPVMPVAIYRPPGAASFSDDDQARLRALQPHFTQALALRYRLLGAGTAGEVMSFECLAQAVVVVARDRRVLRSNPAAESLFLRCPSPLVRHGRLCAGDPVYLAALDAALQSCAGHVPRHDIPLALRLTGPVGAGVVARLAPCPVGTPRGHEAAAVVFLAEEGRTEVNLRALMVSIYQLTPAEAALAAALAEGHTPEGVAETRQVSVATVRTQLRAVFAKTGTRRQSELMRLMYSVAR